MSYIAKARALQAIAEVAGNHDAETHPDELRWARYAIKSLCLAKRDRLNGRVVVAMQFEKVAESLRGYITNRALLDIIDSYELEVSP